LTDLLEGRLGIVDRLRSRPDGLPGRVKKAAEEGLGLVEAAVEIERSGQGLERAGQDRDLLPSAALFLAVAEKDELVELDRPGELGQGQGARRRRFELRQLALVPFRKGAEEELGGDEADDRIAQEFELFVVLADPARS
jgi:hypothetical protein